MANESAEIIIRRVKKVQGGGHHGGAWKVAYADFVTAMMAFFMVMWIVGISDKQQRAAISDYFNNPSATIGTAQQPAAGANGPGGPSSSVIQLNGSMNRPMMDDVVQREKLPPSSPEEARKVAQEQDRKRLEALRVELMKAISQSQALEPFKDQLLLDITKEGLRIQIVDKQNRPMFDLGGASLKSYTTTILAELAKFIDTVPNHISITGHTDTTQYGNDGGYTNWELSTDRANAARRALIAGGMQADKIDRIVGLASTVLFDKQHPDNPINRRISIIVMNQDTEADRRNEAAAVSDVPTPADGVVAATGDGAATVGEAPASVPAAAPAAATAAAVRASSP
ncbi:flagellar motor protein MotB [Solimonas sp. C16B3]|uniref:Flagellar motor protein MotB n=1 Tax=Solimonas marina TaxID=2714601 RepID=A0A969WE68_9GAMM|nr:flagellar motor protein MotB [Solimonas marina]